MQFIVIAHDRKDERALERRMAARPAHIEMGDRYRDEKKLLYAVALLDENGVMVGSVMVVDFESRAELDAWLAVEPYVTGEVWQDIKIMPCKVGPSFAK